MTKIENPWNDMHESSRRRADSSTSHNVFWITDLHGNYGFYLQSQQLFKDDTTEISLNGISILKRNSSENIGELFLILENMEDWQIFKVLCDDLILVTHRYDIDEQMIQAVEIRLKRWQQLLKSKRRHDMSLEVQMGLFSELSCLKEIVIPHSGAHQAIVSWVGPDFDKQDFLLDNAIIEVKSHRTSKGEKIHISSAEQLFSNKEPLYLMAYSLTASDNGDSIEKLTKDIKSILQTESEEIIEMFERKLMDYGYIPEIIQEPLQHFIIDSNKAFAVTDDFPKITPLQIKPQIVSVKYSLELSLCSEYEVDIHTMLLNKDYR